MAILFQRPDQPARASRAREPRINGNPLFPALVPPDETKVLYKVER